LVLGLEKSTKPNSFPLIILLKKLIFKNWLYIYLYLIQCMSVAFSTINDQLRHASWRVSSLIWTETWQDIIFQVSCSSGRKELQHYYLLNYLGCSGVIGGRYFNIAQCI
jgi:hypothetical protein